MMTDTTQDTNSIQSAIASIPSGGTKVLLQFNKVSGAFTAVIGWVNPATLNNEHFVYVEHDNFDFATQDVRGAYPDYQIIDRAQSEPLIYEAQLNAAAQQKITKEYPVINQVNNIGNAIVELGRVVTSLLPEGDAQLTAVLDKLEEMNQYITEVKVANNLRKEYYAGSSEYIYISLAQEYAELEAQLEGGLHEAYGAREITGGTVF